MYSRPSSALERSASRVSFPDRGAYRTPATAPTPKPAKNQRKLLLLLSDISFLLLNLRCSNVSTRSNETQFAYRRTRAGESQLGCVYGLPWDALILTVAA